MKKFQIKPGDSKPFFILSLINGGLYAAWFITYIVCAALRASAFSSAQTSMLASGYTSFTVEVTSPMFAVLRASAYALPVVLGIWIIYYFVKERKGTSLCNNSIILSVFAADVLSALVCATDITMLHMIF